MRRLSKVKIKWSPNFAYAIGLIATDGNLSKDGRHINFTSKDKELADLFKVCLKIDNKIGTKARGGSKEKKYFVVQFGDINFYNFLNGLGLTRAKSKIIKDLKIPDLYFVDFFRGCVDGDGSITSGNHPESRHPQLRLKLYSASPEFLAWIKNMVKINFHIHRGWMTHSSNNRCFELNYGKEDAKKIFDFIYYSGAVCLLRKYKKAKVFMGE